MTTGAADCGRHIVLKCAARRVPLGGEPDQFVGLGEGLGDLLLLFFQLSDEAGQRFELAVLLVGKLAPGAWWRGGGWRRRRNVGHGLGRRRALGGQFVVYLVLRYAS